ncbi:hypothetical protein PTTG_05818 [Puccinia triticina 1-1 BBBD Race 1]|uniref:Uncharacterized protein n=1 Tax=Puccinia triticina (isolate 1-1 / race 1 (BBBD)) TaxID=630390 RepID=A0A180H2S0_PUCT1|nr:hypothetical protein PTTG_05818 [Puccinia triticina 1-1 BBBD Race 1]
MSNQQQSGRNEPSGQRLSNSSAWSGRSSLAGLDGQELINAVAASIQNTPAAITRIFGSSRDVVDGNHQNSPTAAGEDTINVNRIPGAWQQAQPATPGYQYYPELPPLPSTGPPTEAPVLAERHFIPLPRSTFCNPIFPPPAPPLPPPPSFVSPTQSSANPDSIKLIVPPSPPSPNHPTPASFVMENTGRPPVPPHLSAARRAADLEEAKAQLKESKIVGQAIHTATAKIRDNVILSPDGANFEVWSQELAEKSGIHLANKDFLLTGSANSVLEKIGRAIFLALIHNSLKAEIHDASTCKDIYSHMFRKFKTVSRAAQLDVFYQFLEYKNSTEPVPATAASELKNLPTEWKNLKVVLDINIFMGFILQSSIGRDTALGQDFDRRVELELQQSSDNKSPTFDRLVQLLNACKLQDNHTRSSSKVSMVRPSPALLQVSAELPPFDQSAFLADIPESEWGAAIEFYNVTAN